MSDELVEVVRKLVHEGHGKEELTVSFLLTILQRARKLKRENEEKRERAMNSLCAHDPNA